MREKRQTILFPAFLALVVFLVSWAISLVNLENGSIFAQVDRPLQDLLFRLRNRVFPEQPISDAVTLIGVDDKTTETLGRFGEGVWKTREPYITQLLAFLRHQPAIVAYDIIFKEDTEEWGQFRAEGRQHLDQKAIGELLIESAASGSTIRDAGVLLDLSLITVRQATDNLAAAFSELTFADVDQPTTIIFPYSVPDSVRAPWRTSDILGDDPDDLAEDNGLVLPYFRDVRIPLEHVHRIAVDYPFSPARPTMPDSRLFDLGLLGFIQVPRDPGGVVRRYPLIQGLSYTYADPASGDTVNRHVFVPSLALLSVMYYLGIDLVERNLTEDYLVDGKPVVEVHFGRELILRPPGKAQIRVPIDDHGNLLLDFVGRVEDYSSMSFLDSLSYDKRVGDRLRGRIVFVGITETAGTDVGPVPIVANSALVLVHMTAASNILLNTFVRPISSRGELALMLALWLVLAPGAMFMRPRLFTILTGGLLLIYGGICFWMIAGHLYVLPIIAPIAAVLFSCIGTVLYRYFTEEKEKQKIRGMFSTMVSSDVLTYMEEHPESFSLAGERREATIFFSDVAGFTTISESLPPDRLSNLLNQYLSPMTDIIMALDGYVDKYEGDAIMAEWGVPSPDPHHARNGCFAAIDQQRQLAELRPRFQRDFGVEIHVRMGINSGVVSAGNMGSGKRMQYTVMGDAVNQAARFEPANKDYGTLIMMGQSTYDLAREHVDARLLDRIIVKGKTEPIQIYELLERKGQTPDLMLQVVELYQRGLELHWQRNWEEAIGTWRKALELRPDDGPCLALIERVRGYQLQPPGDQWKGEYVRKSKD